MFNRLKRAVLVVLIILLVLSPLLAFAEGDPSGAETLKAEPGAPVDYVWVLICAFLVFLMQGDFAMLETGFCRAKNATNLMAKNLMDFSMGSLAYMAVGFALMFGVDKWGLFGSTGWFLTH